MKYIFIILFTGLFASASFAGGSDNLALCLDGKDNNVRTGIGAIGGEWTLEAWIKGDNLEWRDTEAIFGGGEYSRINTADPQPLVIKNGRLHSTMADLWSEKTLDDRWHHVALSCDGSSTKLYLDGELADSKPIAISVLPGALGINEDASTAFAGMIDEVRVWNVSLPVPEIREWMLKPLSPSHPEFASLVAYYNFDDGIDDVSVNWVGKGGLAYHIRNGRCNYAGSAPLAYTAVNDNPLFAKYQKEQSLFNAVVIASEWDADRGSSDDQILKLRIAVTGEEEALGLTELTVDLSEVTSLSDICKIHVYHTGKSARSEIKTELFGNGRVPKKKMVFKAAKGEAVKLDNGINYFLVTADISDSVAVGNKIRISVPSFKLDGKKYIPRISENKIDKQITANSKTDAGVLRVLQWNIWHGGRHLGSDGLERVIELIKATGADVVTMQEGYGSQSRIRDSLGYYMQTPSPDDNLALFSRYPLEPLPTGKTFNSNPTVIKLPGKSPVLVNSCWLRYAYEPEYTCYYPSRGFDTDVWVAEDSIRGLEDMRYIQEKDTKPYLLSEDMPVIIAGDFNSCSHLDWTERAAPVHFGYGPVAFPISRYMLERGYKDSFREINPDELERPEGTFAPIYGHLQTSRIDFIYYRGKGIKAVSSKVIKTAPEIDDVWASDHAAVLTTFQIDD